MGRTECTIPTLNAFHDLPTYRHLARRRALIAEEIAARRPHVAALQEVLRASGCGDIGVKLCDAINRLCGGEVYHLDYTRADGAGDGEFGFDEGLALMSRIETDGPAQSLRFRAQVGLAAEVGGYRYRLPDDRVALRRRFRLESGIALDFYVSHLTDRPECIDGIAVRTREARELAGWALDGSGPGTTVVLAGDFNDVPGSETIASLKCARLHRSTRGLRQRPRLHQRSRRHRSQRRACDAQSEDRLPDGESGGRARARGRGGGIVRGAAASRERRDLAMAVGPYRGDRHAQAVGGGLVPARLWLAKAGPSAERRIQQESRYRAKNRVFEKSNGNPD
jgi:endonuclease/exonuclease/phosphatase family metal-dependent hydrolase